MSEGRMMEMARSGGRGLMATAHLGSRALGSVAGAIQPAVGMMVVMSGHLMYRDACRDFGDDPAEVDSAVAAARTPARRTPARSRPGPRT